MVVWSLNTTSTAAAGADLIVVTSTILEVADGVAIASRLPWKLLRFNCR